MEKGEWTLGLQPLKFKVIYQDLRLRHIRIKTKRQMASESHVISCIYIHAFFLFMSLFVKYGGVSEWKKILLLFGFSNYYCVKYF